MASERRDAANHVCIHIWCAAIGIAPCFAACDVAKVKQSIAAVERASKRPPIQQNPITSYINVLRDTFFPLNFYLNLFSFQFLGFMCWLMGYIWQLWHALSLTSPRGQVMVRFFNFI